MKRTLSLILAVVMVAIMIPFAAIATSAADESANLVELDESKYSSIYSLDFTTLNSTDDLTNAGWFFDKTVATPEDKDPFDIFTFTDEGLKYHHGSDHYFALNAVEFNANDDYVVEFTAKMPKLTKRLVMAFGDAPVNKPGDNVWCLRDDGDNAGFTFKKGYFYTDATYSESTGKGTLSKINADAYAAIQDNADVRIRIFVTAGVANYLVLSVEGYGDFYVYDSGVNFGKVFHFAGNDSTSAGRYVTFQNFTVYKVGEIANPTLDLTANLTAGATSYNTTTEGIRFTTTVAADDLQKLVDLESAGTIAKVEVGTLITTKAWADAAGKVSFEALDAIKGDKTAYVAVMATIGDFYAENTFAGTIGNAKAEREYVAVGFVKVTLTNGSVVYSYSAATNATLASVQG